MALDHIRGVLLISPLLETITFAIHDLCLHPEYVQPLREELHAGYAEFERTSTGLPLLDSFVKESARLTPVESSKLHRSPFRLQGHARAYLLTEITIK